MQQVTPQDRMWALGEKLFPIKRSLIGKAFEESLYLLFDGIPEVEYVDVPSGSHIFDWKVPNEWIVHEAKLIDPSGKVICDYADLSLKIVSYSIPIEGQFSLEELSEHIYTLPDQPNAIPYVTSYYSPNWGFCMSHEEFSRLEYGEYTVRIRTEFVPGRLRYAQVFVPGRLKEEILLTSYLCHPEMANNELSGPLVLRELALKLQSQANRFSYRLIIAPETIGALALMKNQLQHFKRFLIGGLVLTCVGDDRGYSYMPTRHGDSVIDQASRSALQFRGEYTEYSWLDRGSDERQYCSPGANFNVGSIMRSKYGTFPEYHTNLDKFGEVVTREALLESLSLYWEVIQSLEVGIFPTSPQVGEPMLSKRNLYTEVQVKSNYALGGQSPAKILQNILSLSDGKSTTFDIARQLGIEHNRLVNQFKLLEDHGLLDFSPRERFVN